MNGDSSQSIKIMLVEDNPGDARLFREFLNEVTTVEFHVTQAERLSEALEMLGAQSFDAVLLDLRLPDSEGFDTFARVREKVPDVPIVVLTGLLDESVGVMAVEGGAQDYLIKGQVGGESLARSIRYAIVRQGSQAELLEKLQRVRGKVLGFMGAKGGVGTSTTAVNVAAALAQMGKTVNALELTGDLGTFSTQLGRVPTDNLSHLVKATPKRVSGVDLAGVLTNMGYGLRVLFSPQRMEEIVEIEPEVAEEMVEGLAGMAQYTIVDLGAHPIPSAGAAGRHCDFLCVVTQPGPVGVKAARVLVEIIHSWGLGEERTGVVIVNRGGLASPVNMLDYKARIGCDIIAAIPPDVEGCLSAEQRGKPIVIDQPDTLPAQGLIDLARRLAADKIVPMHT